MTKVLLTTPLAIPSYFNAGHRITLFEVATYLKSKSYDTTVHDNSLLNSTWKDFADRLYQKSFDYIALFNDFDLIDGFDRTLEYIREFQPNAKVVTFGRLSSKCPDFFQKYKLDGIIETGDFEPGVYAFIQSFTTKEFPRGVALNNGVEWITSKEMGDRLSADDLVLPDIDDIDYNSYFNLYERDQRKFCGIPERKELVVPIARGCPVGCDFCETWPRQGLSERRVSVPRVIDYIKKSLDTHDFDYVSMYAPTFTLNRKWVTDLCLSFLQSEKKYYWKCTTTIHHLDKELVTLMGKAGCIRISVGVETLSTESRKKLPRQKQNSTNTIENIVTWCAQAGIELNCFILLGLPDASVEDTLSLYSFLQEQKVRIRPSILCDYSLLDKNMLEKDAVKLLSRHILPSSLNYSQSEKRQIYGIFFGEEKNLTQVMNKIPKNRTR